MNAKNFSRKNFIKQLALTGAAASVSDLLFVGIPSSFFSFYKTDNVEYFTNAQPEYETLRHGFNKRIDKHPKIIALCKNTNGVAEAIKYAKANNLPVAIKSGGHCMEGFSCNNNGLVVNLSLLNKINRLDAETISVGPALLLKDLYAAVLPKGKILPGGSCQTVALGGLALGGGYGLLSRQFGLTCDSLIKVEMIDGNGNIISTDNDNELLWGCKGGANGNFGVITKMDFKLHPAPALMQSFRFRYRNIPVEKVKPLVEEWFALAATLPEHCFSAIVVNSKAVYILLTSTKKTTDDIAQQIQKLTAITTSVQHTPPKVLQQALKAYYAEDHPVYFKNASAGLYHNFNDINKCFEDVLAVIKKSPGIIFQVNTLGGKVQDETFQQQSSFPYRQYNFFSELQAYYETPAQAKPLIDKFEQIQKLFYQNGIFAQYRNYPDVNFKNPLQQY